MSSDTVIPNFQTLDYAVFGITLMISMGIGIFFAFKGNKNTDDFLMGGRSMSVLPVALSLLSSYISATGILGNAGEVYGHGLEIAISAAGYIFGIIAAANIFLPVFYPLEMTSVNQYIEMRFKSKYLRLVILVVNGWIFLAVSGLGLYAPTLALSSVTPLSTNAYIIILGVVVTLYSTIGGLKAVVWTDTFQMGVIMTGIVAIIIVGANDVGGLDKVWSISREHGRTELFDMSVNIYERHNFINILSMGLIMSFAIYGASQTTLQRACSVSSTEEARRVYYINMVGMILCMCLMNLSGLCAYASYANCDPISRNHIFTKDQILPYFVMDKMGYIYGMPGLFVATLVSGALSSLSSFINSLAAMVWSDGLQKFQFFLRMSPKAAATVSKIISMMVGMCVIVLAFMSKNLAGLNQANVTLISIMAGPLLGLFVVGLLIPRCGRKSAWAGFLISVGLMSWIAIGATIYKPKLQLLPLSTSSCPVDPTSLPTSVNVTSMFHDVTPADFVHVKYSTAASASTIPDDNYERSINEWPMMYLYGISYTLYTPLSTLTCVLFAVLTSFIVGKDDAKDIRPELIAPVVRRFLPDSDKKKTADIPDTSLYIKVNSLEYDLKDFNKVPPPHLMSPNNPKKQNYDESSSLGKIS